MGERPPQAMRPRGITGRLFAGVMERMNRPVCRWALDALAEQPPGSLLEIGHGTGDLLAMCRRKWPGMRLCGVDPSGLMHEMAARRVPDADLRVADDTGLDWPPGSFDAVAALHAFQFWADAPATLARLNELLRPEGRLVVVLRLHGTRPPDWLPNALSKSANEAEAAAAAMRDAGFGVLREERLGSGSHAIVARRA